MINEIIYYRYFTSSTHSYQWKVDIDGELNLLLHKFWSHYVFFYVL